MALHGAAGSKWTVGVARRRGRWSSGPTGRSCRRMRLLRSSSRSGWPWVRTSWACARGSVVCGIASRWCRPAWSPVSTWSTRRHRRLLRRRRRAAGTWGGRQRRHLPARVVAQCVQSMRLRAAAAWQLRAAAQPGDVVRVKAGSYGNQTLTLDKGLARDPFKPADGETASFATGDVPAWCGVGDAQRLTMDTFWSRAGRLGRASARPRLPRHRRQRLLCQPGRAGEHPGRRLRACTPSQADDRRLQPAGTATRRRTSSSRVRGSTT